VLAKPPERILDQAPFERILDTATWLFYREGIQAVGVNRIVAVADVAPMTLYRRFGSKDALVAAALQHWSDRWLGWLRARLDRCGEDPRARLAGLWDALEEWFATREFRGSFVANAAVELHGKPGHPGHKAIAAHRAAFRELLLELTTGVGARDPATAATKLLVLLEGTVAVAVIERRRPSIDAVRALATAALAEDR